MIRNISLPRFGPSFKVLLELPTTLGSFKAFYVTRVFTAILLLTVLREEVKVLLLRGFVEDEGVYFCF